MLDLRPADCAHGPRSGGFLPTKSIPTSMADGCDTPASWDTSLPVGAYADTSKPRVGLKPDLQHCIAPRNIPNRDLAAHRA